MSGSGTAPTAASAPDLPDTLDSRPVAPDALGEVELHGLLLRGNGKLGGWNVEASRLERVEISCATLSRCELRGCRLDGLGNSERLRGARMPMTDVVSAADVLAAAVGIEIVGLVLCGKG